MADPRLTGAGDHGEPAPQASIRFLQSCRQEFRRHFKPGFFADPAFDILLHLFIGEEDGIMFSVADCGAAAGVSPSTALRWIDAMVSDGMLVRDPAAPDAHAATIELSPGSRAAMRAWLDAVAAKDGNATGRR